MNCWVYRLEIVFRTAENCPVPHWLVDFHVAGSIAHTSMAPPRATKIAQPRGWEGDDSSTTTSAWSSDASASLAAAASMGMDDGGPSGGGRVLSGGRMGVSVAGLNSLDREFQRVLKAGVDVFKHPCENANKSIRAVVWFLFDG